jgi:hypothetical protein
MIMMPYRSPWSSPQLIGLGRLLAPHTLRQRHHRDQPGVRHEIRVIKRCVRLRQAMQQSHLPGVLSN